MFALEPRSTYSIFAASRPIPRLGLAWHDVRTPKERFIAKHISPTMELEYSQHFTRRTVHNKTGLDDVFQGYDRHLDPCACISSLQQSKQCSTFAISSRTLEPGLAYPKAIWCGTLDRQYLNHCDLHYRLKHARRSSGDSISLLHPV